MLQPAAIIARGPFEIYTFKASFKETKYSEVSGVACRLSADGSRAVIWRPYMSASQVMPAMLCAWFQRSQVLIILRATSSLKKKKKRPAGAAR